MERLGLVNNGGHSCERGIIGESVVYTYSE